MDVAGFPLVNVMDFQAQSARLDGLAKVQRDFGMVERAL
jgi:hypothetical protein